MLAYDDQLSQQGRVNLPQPTPTLELARHLVAGGISVVPVSLGGEKRPAAAVLPPDPDDPQKRAWKPYQTRRPTDDELRHWFGNGRRLAIAAIGGAISGNLEQIDVDDAGLIAPFSALVEAVSPGLLARLVHIETPRPGWRLLYRCEAPVEGNQKLAMGERTDPTTGERQLKALIETRGEGGYGILPGSPAETHESGRPYLLISGDPADPPAITAAERQVLLEAARALTEYVEPARRVHHHEPVPARGGLRPGDDYSGRGDVAAVLEKHGWIPVHWTGDTQHWRRPGKLRGTSATLNHVAANVLYVFTPNAPPFEAGHAYTAFSAYALLEHAGDFRAAAKALAAEGYGEQRPPARGAAEPGPAPMPLRAIIETFHRWLYLPDDGHIKFVLGSYAANRLDGDPVWSMLVGAPGSGKTELLTSLGSLSHVAARSALTGEAALLSGSARRERAADASGGLLREIGEFGVLVLKDFTTILSMKHEQRSPLLAALREVFDGSYTRSIGVDGGKTLAWTGKLGLIAGCTPTIDSHHAVIGAMGERFVFYRIPVADADMQARSALAHAGTVKSMRAELAAAVAALFSGLSDHSTPAHLTAEEEQRLVDLSVLAVRCRSAVERDGRTRAIDLIPDPEAPGRLAGILQRLLNGMLMIGVERDDAWRLLARVCADSMPALRWAAFRHAATQPDGAPVSTTEFSLVTRHPSVTVRRALEDLHAHGVMIRTKNSRSDDWALSPWARERYERLAPWLTPSVPGLVPADATVSEKTLNIHTPPSRPPLAPPKYTHTASGGFFGYGGAVGTSPGTDVDLHARAREGDAGAVPTLQEKRF